MTWFSAIVVALVALAVAYTPGAVIAAAAGARRHLLIVAAPAVTVSTFATAGLVFPAFGIAWNPASVGAFSIALALIALAVRLLVVRGRPRRERPSPRKFRGGFGIALPISAAIICTQLVLVYGRPDSVSQTYDAAFHLNGVRYILDTLNGSSLHLTGMILPEGQSSFYPAGWHDLVSIVAMITGGDVVTAANMSNLVVAAVIWPIGILTLVELLAPARTSALVVAAVLATAAPSFPLGMLDYGVLYPYFLALAFLPGAIALGLSITRLTRTDLLGPIPLQVLALIASLGAMAISQTSVVFGFAALGFVGVCARVLTLMRTSLPAMTKVAAGAGALVAGIVLLAAWWKFGSVGYTAPWQPYASPLRAAFEALTSSRNGTPPAILLTILLLVGIVSEIRRGRWWLPVMWTVPAFLFALSAFLPSGNLRNAALGVFYKDPPRLAALSVPLTVVLAALGAFAIWMFISKRVASRTAGTTAVRVSAAVCAVVLVAGGQGIAMQSAISRAAAKYDLSNSSQILSQDERSLLERIDAEVPKDAVIVGNPWTGTSWAYALEDRRVLNPHFNSSTAPENLMVNRHLNDALDDPEVCAALKRTGVDYVLDFGADRFGGRITVDTSIGYEGLLDLDHSSVVEEVDRVNDKVLYRITACGL